MDFVEGTVDVEVGIVRVVVGVVVDVFTKG